jgi:hypothetical protein
MTGKTKTIEVVIAIILALLAGTGIAAEDGIARDAVSAAERWLALVDRGSYTASFHEAAASFQQGSSPQHWEQVLRSDREPEGSVISRKVKRSVHRVGPLGRDNVEIWYETSFQNRRSAVERVYTRFEQDGQWRVTGYIIDAGELGLENILMALLLAAVIIGVFLREVKLHQRPASDVQNDSFPEQDGSRW